METNSLVINGAGAGTLPSGKLNFAVDVTPKRHSDASFNGLVKLSGTIDDPNVDVDDSVIKKNAIVGILAMVINGKPSAVSRQDRMQRCSG